jgi:hypothetical protein
MSLMVNGKKETVAGGPGSYVAIEREWKDGDTIDVRLPMSLRLEAMPDDPTIVAILYGPIVLGGDLGKEGLDDARRYGPNAPQLGRVKPVRVPAFVSDSKDLLANIKPVQGSVMNFRTTGLGQPSDVLLMPFYKMADDRYTVYWKVYSTAEWEKKKNDAIAAEARRKEIEKRTIDAVVMADAQSEPQHNYKQEGAIDGLFFDGKRLRASRNWFSYELKVAGDKPVKLACTYRGSQGGRQQAFDILVDGEKIASQTLEINPTEFFDYEYAIPEALTRGKERITVKFQAHPESTAGALADVRVFQ